MTKNVCVCITESLCCTAEINRALGFNSNKFVLISQLSLFNPLLADSPSHIIYETNDI